MPNDDGGSSANRKLAGNGVREARSGVKLSLERKVRQWLLSRRCGWRVIVMNSLQW